MNDDWQDLYHKYAADLLFYVKKYIDEETAIDLVQDAFLEFHLASQKRKIENGKAYVFGIARNLLLKHFRKNKIKTLPIEKIFDLEDKSQSGLDAKIMKSELLVKLFTADSSFSEIFTLKIDFNLSVEEIAKIRNVSTRTIRRKLEKIFEISRDFLK